MLNYGRNELFHNNGNGRFTEVSTKAGLTDARFSLSAVWYDYNHDGFLDLFIGNYVKMGIPLTQPTTTCRFQLWRTIRERFRNSRIDFRPRTSAGCIW